MFYLIQDSTEEMFPVLLQTLHELGLAYEVCKYIPFAREIEFATTRKDVWCFGAYELVALSDKYGFVPGQMANANHDFRVYAPKYGDNMLNGDSIVIDFTMPLPNGNQGDLFFAKPTKDTKVFAGRIFTLSEWNEFVSQCIANGTATDIENETKIIISSPKNINQEIRCWVVNGTVVTISQYKLNNRVIAKNLDDDAEAIAFAQQMVGIFPVARAFVIDICRTHEGFKIVEINCINAAGFYQMDCSKLLVALENEFGQHCATIKKQTKR